MWVRFDRGASQCTLAAFACALWLSGVGRGHAQVAHATVIVAIVHDRDDVAVYEALEALLDRPLVRVEAQAELADSALAAAASEHGAAIVVDVDGAVVRVWRAGGVARRALEADAAGSAYARALVVSELLELAADERAAAARGAASAQEQALAAARATRSPSELSPDPGPDTSLDPLRTPAPRVAAVISLGAGLSLPLDGAPWLVQPSLGLTLLVYPGGDELFVEASVYAAALGRFSRSAPDDGRVEYARADALAAIGIGTRVGILSLSVRAVGGISVREGQSYASDGVGRGAVVAVVPELGAQALVHARLVEGLFVGLAVSSLWILAPTTFTLGGLSVLREGAPHLLIDAHFGWAFE